MHRRSGGGALHIPEAHTHTRVERRATSEQHQPWREGQVGRWKRRRVKQRSGSGERYGADAYSRKRSMHPFYCSFSLPFVCGRSAKGGRHEAANKKYPQRPLTTA
ncbi:hypothetical protein, unknown function [Leishmania donovani]|uniref:Uncharacterized protein n=1 Tax=Leishmania donovani TaxID=5661 RepID=E9BRB7_LEIDO|nr:hypothetical protein, unknown function [Leishmania donovani]CBZ37796.1 hypothetical protein, unknown function [Leishmania donovani]